MRGLIQRNESPEKPGRFTAALRLLHERDALWHAHEDTICKQVAQGLDSLDAGRGVTVSDTELFSAARDAYRGG